MAMIGEKVQDVPMSLRMRRVLARVKRMSAAEGFQLLVKAGPHDRSRGPGSGQPPEPSDECSPQAQGPPKGLGSAAYLAAHKSDAVARPNNT